MRWLVQLVTPTMADCFVRDSDPYHEPMERRNSFNPHPHVVAH